MVRQQKGGFNLDKFFDRFRKDKNKQLIISSILLIISFFVISAMFARLSIPAPEEKTYNEFIKMVENKEVASVTIDIENGDIFSFEDKDGKFYTTDNPKVDNFKEYLLSNDVSVKELNSKK